MCVFSISACCALACVTCEYIYVCVRYVYVCKLCVYVYHVYIDVDQYTQLYVYNSTCMIVYVRLEHIRLLCTRLCKLSIHLRVCKLCIYVYMYICIYPHTHTHTHAHTHTHTHTHTLYLCTSIYVTLCI